VKDVGRYFKREVLSAKWLINAQSVTVGWFYQSNLVQGIGIFVSNNSFNQRKID
jgi:hypothetical protein